MTIYDKLVRLRKGKGWSQEELAEKLDVSRQAVSRWENGTALPDAENLRQLSRLLGVSTDYLLNDEYESDDDIPRVKSAEAALDTTVKKNRKILLTAAVAFIIAAVAFLITAIDRMDIMFVILAIANAVLSGIFAYRYERSKDDQDRPKRSGSDGR